MQTAEAVVHAVVHENPTKAVEWNPEWGQDQLTVHYTVESLELSQLFVDYHEDILTNGKHSDTSMMILSYQRKQDKIADRIVRDGLNSDLFGTLTVNRRSQHRQHKYAIVDGGSRWRALGRLNAPLSLKVPCLVYNWNDLDEMKNFVKLNQERTGLTAVDLFCAKVKYMDPDATRIQQMLIRETGVGVSPKKGSWACIYTLERADRNGTLQEILRLIKQLGWLDHQRGKTQNVVGGIDIVLHQNADPEIALRKWRALDPTKIYNEARTLKTAGSFIGGGGSRSMVKVCGAVLAAYYNKNFPIGSPKRIDVVSLALFGDQEDEDE
jgi:hypothetical protein